ELCKAVADGVNLPRDQRQALEIAAWLHDIGLVGVPRRLIKRWERDPGCLTDEERAVVEQHPILGEELAGFVHNLGEVGAVIRAHHERYDGTGYPDRLAAENIPWLARLLAVAVFYAGSNHPPETTVDLIKRQAGTAFDPEAVRLFLRHLPQAVVPRRQRAVTLAELRPGMVLARGIYTANGLLLVPDGQRLTEAYIDKLHHHHRLHPISQSLLVMA
ncbi:MAG TPA: HD domain-containing phosphohydrolase, partial [Methylomirabilota bacterium]|nr:HD domain-containing phosphohydrolase [Methylomirabilota bacterium]